MATIGALCRRDPILCTTEHLTVDVSDDEQVANATVGGHGGPRPGARAWS